jgi:diadenosine tetraphosphate (Ap4A) HIT family hydrolase
MRRSSSAGLRVPTMSESMEQLMEKEIAEAIATLNKANRALDRLFNTQEGDDDE